MSFFQAKRITTSLLNKVKTLKYFVKENVDILYFETGDIYLVGICWYAER